VTDRGQQLVSAFEQISRRMQEAGPPPAIVLPPGDYAAVLAEITAGLEQAMVAFSRMVATAADVAAAFAQLAQHYTSN
jgi:hypothetical protein